MLSAIGLGVRERYAVKQEKRQYTENESLITNGGAQIPLLELVHFKGYGMLGLGGAIKNISIGLGSSEGKSLDSYGGASRTSPCGGEQDTFGKPWEMPGNPSPIILATGNASSTSK